MASSSSNSDSSRPIQWRKSLEKMPPFTRVQIEKHRELSGKRKISTNKKGVPIMKTLRRGSQFKEERYLSSDTIFTSTSEEGFLVKSKCKAIMKKEYHSQNVTLQHETGNIISAYCTCKAGKSSYCNHIMALLLELAEYSLYELTGYQVRLPAQVIVLTWINVKPYKIL